jgi:hypothetical protein
MKKSLSKCPSCSGPLLISQYRCPSCELDINGEFEGCMFCNLSDEDRYFALVFLQTGGNIKDVERVMGISYPTVKAKLAQLLQNLGVRDAVAGNADWHGGDYAKLSRHALLVESKRMRKEIKDKIHGHIRGRIRAGIHMAKEDIEEALKKGTPATEEARETVKKEVKGVLDELKSGGIDVAEALRRLKGEGEEDKAEAGDDEGTRTDDGVSLKMEKEDESKSTDVG